MHSGLLEKIKTRLADTLLRRVPFLSAAQAGLLCRDLFPQGLNSRDLTDRLRPVLKQLVEGGLLDCASVTTYPKPIIRLKGEPKPLVSWRRGGERPNATLAMHALRKRLPKTGPYQKTFLYFATPTTGTLAEGVELQIDCQLVRMNLEKELRRWDELNQAKQLDLSRFNAKEFQDSLADFFVICYLNMSYLYINLFHSAPGVTKTWTPRLVSKQDSDSQVYPHAVLDEGGKRIAVFFAGSLGPIVLGDIHNNLAGNYDGYDGW
jgi:hypothetical protein